MDRPGPAHDHLRGEARTRQTFERVVHGALVGAQVFLRQGLGRGRGARPGRTEQDQAEDEQRSHRGHRDLRRRGSRQANRWAAS